MTGTRWGDLARSQASGATHRHSIPVALNRQAYHSRWDPVIGIEAAELKFCAYRTRQRYANFMGAMTASTLASAAIHSSSAFHWIFLALAVGALAVAGGYLVVWFRIRRRWYSPATTFLGVTVTDRNNPPFNQTGFAKWCARNGVSPERPPGRSPTSSVG